MHAASSDGWDEITKDRYSGRTNPEWSPDKDVKVHRMFLSCVDSMIKPRGEQPSLMDTIVYLTGVRATPPDTRLTKATPLVGHCLHLSASK